MKSLEWLVKFFEEISPDLGDIYERVNGRSVSEFRTQKIFESTSSGAHLSAIPVASYITIPSDILHLLRIMSIICYGVGAIKGRKGGFGNILEKDDFLIILARWAKVEELKDIAVAKYSAEMMLKTSKKVAAKKFAKCAIKRSGAVVGRRIAKKTGVKMASKLTRRLSAKVATRWIPFISLNVGGGSNWYVCQEIATEAEIWYDLKMNL